MTGYWSTKSKSTSRVILSVVVSLLLALLLFNLVTADGVKHDASESGFKHTFNKPKGDSNVLTESELREKCDRVGEEGLNEQCQGWRKSDLSNGYPVQIVDIGNGTLQLKEEELKKILMQPSLENKRVMVLSIAGVFRSGKSFLLSLLIRYLTQGGSKSWLDEQESILEGFEWRSGSKRVTSGIWVWSKVFFIGPDDNKIGVVLMDTQGTQAPYTSTKENTAVFALSTLLSSVQIYNVKSDINEADLQFLELVVRYGIVVKEYNADNKPFQTLFFLIRDWPYVDESNYGKDGGMEHLSKCMATSPMQSQENIDLRKSMYEVFTNIMCFLMPHPGNKIAFGKSSGHIRDIGEEFQEQIKDLVKILFSSEISVKKIDGKDMTCGSLVDYFKSYVKTINEVEYDITTIAEAHAMARDRQSFIDVMLDIYMNKDKAHAMTSDHQSYIDMMLDFDMNKDKLGGKFQESLTDIHGVMKKQALEDFKENSDSYPSKKYGELKVGLEKNIDDIMQTDYKIKFLIGTLARCCNHKLLAVPIKRSETGMNEIKKRGINACTEGMVSKGGRDSSTCSILDSLDGVLGGRDSSIFFILSSLVGVLVFLLVIYRFATEVLCCWIEKWTTFWRHYGPFCCGNLYDLEPNCTEMKLRMDDMLEIASRLKMKSQWREFAVSHLSIHSDVCDVLEMEKQDQLVCAVLREWLMREGENGTVGKLAKHVKDFHQFDPLGYKFLCELSPP